MSRAKDFQKQNPDGNRFAFSGVDIVHPAEALPPGKYPYAQNIRAYIRDRVTSRATQDSPSVVNGQTMLLASAVHSLRRLNDSTPLGPPDGYTLISGAGTGLYAAASQVANGLSGNPLSMVPFRPNTSVQPWMYVADSALSGVMIGAFQAPNGMVKVRSDGTCYAMGIKEPQDAPTVGTASTTVSGNLTLPGTTIPWSTASGQNASYAFGDTTGIGTAPVVISTPVAGSSVKITAAGTVNIGGTDYTPGSAGQTTPTYPGHFLTHAGPCAILIGAFTDASGNIVSPVAGSDLDVISVGGTASLVVPTNAVQFQLGINARVADFATNTGSFIVDYQVTTSAIATEVSLLGNVTAYYWGDSPHSGPVAAYIWHSPTDNNGWGPTRGIATAAGSTTGNSLLFDDGGQGTPLTNPMQWTIFNGTVSSGTKSVFEPALESEGYADFNMIIVGQLFIPSAGTYTFHVDYKDNILWGIGGNASWAGKGTFVGGAQQIKTVLNNSPLLPAPLISGSGGVVGHQDVAVTFPAAGLYPIEVDYDFWTHSGRQLTVLCNGKNITPLSGNYKQNVQYRYVYRSSPTGALSNPSPESIQENLPVLANTVVATWSPDPQVDKIDFYRFDTGLLNYTYVLTTDNTNPPTVVTDPLLDTDVAANPILQFDNYQPFPVIDLPHKGTVNVVGNLVEWATGDQFDVRWLPGTIINIGGIAYTLDRRPTSTTVLTAGDVAAGNGQIYEIDEPILAAQPMPSLWGPTSQGSFMFGCGDPLNPGTVYWTKGNNPDSAPDTNQVNLTSPSEPFINGCIANGISVAFTSERSWIFYPTFTSALATVTGALGQTWNPVLSGMSRGLYIRKCIAVSGGRLIFFRVKDGISVSDSGGAEVSITDDDLYNLFPHEGAVPQPITVGTGVVVYPPDDTNPEAQQFAVANGYLYYDYQDTTGTQRTLVYDIVAKGWVIDTYDWAPLLHVLAEGPNVNGTLTGNADGSVRALVAQGQEVNQVCSILTPAVDAGEFRADKQIGDLFLKASVDSVGPVTVNAFENRYAMPIPGINPTTLTGANTYEPYIVDFPGGAVQVDDVELSLAWKTGTQTIMEGWQPDWIPLPDTVQDRTSDWDDAGFSGPKWMQGIRIEADTFGQDKIVQIQSGDDLSIVSFNEAPCNFNGQSIRTFSFPPFVSHSVRLISSDGVPWRTWGVQYIFKPFPPSVEQWKTEFNSLGLTGWGSIREMNIPYISDSDLTLNLNFESWPTLSYTIPSSGGLQAKFKQTIAPNKFKLVQFEVISNARFRIFEPDVEVKLGQWGRTESYEIVKPFGAMSATGAEA